MLLQTISGDGYPIRSSYEAGLGHPMYADAADSTCNIDRLVHSREMWLPVHETGLQWSRRSHHRVAIPGTGQVVSGPRVSSTSRTDNFIVQPSSPCAGHPIQRSDLIHVRRQSPGLSAQLTPCTVPSILGQPCISAIHHSMAGKTVFFALQTRCS